MKSTKTMLAYDSAECSPLARTPGSPLVNRSGCRLVLRDLHEIAADALDPRRTAPAAVRATERDEVLTMFPHMNRLG